MEKTTEDNDSKNQSSVTLPTDTDVEAVEGESVSKTGQSVSLGLNIQCFSRSKGGSGKQDKALDITGLRKLAKVIMEHDASDPPISAEKINLKGLLEGLIKTGANSEVHFHFQVKNPICSRCSTQLSEETPASHRASQRNSSTVETEEPEMPVSDQIEAEVEEEMNTETAEGDSIEVKGVEPEESEAVSFSSTPKDDQVQSSNVVAGSQSHLSKHSKKMTDEKKVRKGKSTSRRSLEKSFKSQTNETKSRKKETKRKSEPSKLESGASLLKQSKPKFFLNRVPTFSKHQNQNRFSSSSDAEKLPESALPTKLTVLKHFKQILSLFIVTEDPATNMTHYRCEYEKCGQEWKASCIDLIMRKLNGHLKYHKNPERHTCDICGLIFEKTYSVTRHKITKHQAVSGTKRKDAKIPSTLKVKRKGKKKVTATTTTPTVKSEHISESENSKASGSENPKGSEHSKPSATEHFKSKESQPESSESESEFQLGDWVV